MLDITTKMTESDWLRWQMRERPSIAEQLNLWLRFAQDKKTYPNDEMCPWQLSENGIEVLVRYRTNGMDEPCLVLSTIRLPKEIQRKGWLKSFLTYCINVNPWEEIIIEDVENKDLFNFFKKLDFTIFDDFHSTTFMVNKQAVIDLVTPPLGQYSDYL
ncbi:hypothetical protein [Yersinia enterocolitica]|uniref:hypothetical protein n=1 Tax=Yersinia enterocolitica TaxID=630 RepID=UPI001C60CC47|nr:hypothetical protein [Yersinia enterocolitica]EKN4034342.1 hypothetical protein [Yersinia enterocolitica]EKN5962788.1 hypothetical protein [Yersinia enterocolitica]EKN6143184.1 hypothetical protein [Yersinia enterocolitica]ELI8070542.1 hypothetical protein [Yersinia enterocolitica]MBW5855919.1 hypothetical protein [Yersinia enterocolitica]